MGGSLVHDISLPSPENLDRWCQLEWLLTNGIGGFASSTIAGINTRRYHSLLTAALKPPVERVVTVSKLDEFIHQGSEIFPLCANEFGDGTISPHGFRSISRFYLESLLPVWEFNIQSAILEKRIWMQHGENKTFIRYTLLKSNSPIQLILRPLCCFRDFHSHQHGPQPFNLHSSNTSFTLTFGQDTDSASLHAIPSQSITTSSGEFFAAPDWYWNFFHRAEAARGLDTREDLLCPGEFRVSMSAGDSVTLLLECSTNEARTALSPKKLHAASFHSHGKELQRRQKLRQVSEAANPSPDPLFPTLAIAADAFVVTRKIASKKTPGKSIIAGYPWFSDWTRDTMISLPGILLSTGRLEDARSVLLTYEAFAKDGLLPNRFPDEGEELEFNSVDGVLWYFVAIYRYFKVTEDKALLKSVLPTLSNILEHFRQGTRFNIHVNPTDKLLFAGCAGVQLTWMDAKLGSWVVTPRVGKPVEINALWVNALFILSEFASICREPALQKSLRLEAEQTMQSFEQRFWNNSGGYLFDVIDIPITSADQTQNTNQSFDDSFRPNQVIACSLPFLPVSIPKAQQVLEKCETILLTPFGLRTLSPSHPDYKPRYAGTAFHRDSSYHQGTVWPWLIGCYVRAHINAFGKTKKLVAQLAQLREHFFQAGLGQVSEIFDADPPHSPEGCIAQAWSLGELIAVTELLQEDD